jgi:tetratricopeptide (TPR) repeat protein
MMENLREMVLYEPANVTFGDLPPRVEELLREGVVAQRRDHERADRLFREALALAPDELPIYYCLYKVQTRMGRLDAAAAIAREGMEQAARQAGWSLDPGEWPEAEACKGPGRFAVFTLKALSFIELKRGNRERALANLDHLARLDPSGGVGWPVVLALAAGTEGTD